MIAERAAQFLLVVESIACLAFAGFALRQAKGRGTAERLAGAVTAALFFGAAAVIAYGLAN